MMIDIKNIIGIFKANTFKKYLAKQEKTSKNQEKCASYILTDQGIFFSEIAPVTLKKRAENVFSN